MFHVVITLDHFYKTVINFKVWVFFFKHPKITREQDVITVTKVPTTSCLAYINKPDMTSDTTAQFSLS